MSTEIYVQARMGSTRLPGKVMKTVLGKPLLEFLIERLKRVKKATAIVVLTTTDARDDAIVNYCKEHNIACIRGPEDDVLARYWLAAKERKPTNILRVTSDCPLIDPEIIDQLITVFESGSYDYVSNSLERTYPRGLDVEMFTIKGLNHAYEEAKDPFEREHVTPYFYRHPELFRLKNVSSPEALSHHRWTVDTLEDFTLIKLILENLYPTNPHFLLNDVLNLLKIHPDWLKINAHIKQK